LKALKLRVLLLSAAMVAAALGLNVAKAADGTATNGFITSVEGAKIYYTLFKPAAASASNKVPLIFHSHGWAGVRSTDIAEWTDWLNDGFGILSFDQRGHGQSGGLASVEDPNFEGQDVRKLVDFVATLDWVLLDGPGDPVIGAIGGSYGGGYQTMGALTDLRDLGHTRFNAIAPEITWYDLPDSLGPQDVPRTLWTTALYAVAPPHAGYIDQGEAFGLATATFPDGSVPGSPNLKQIFYEHSPKFFADQGKLLDIPVLFGQGITDNLFNLNQGLHNYARVLTPAAQAKSIVVGYNSGHVLPEALPLATNPSGNPCIEDWSEFERGFFHAVFAGLNPRVALGDASGPVKTYNIATSDNGCIRSNTISNYKSFAVGPLGAIATTNVLGAAVAYPLASGPIKIAGIPHLKGSLTTLVADARAFFAISVGATPATAQVIQNNLLPLRRLLPTIGESIDIELPGIAIDVPAGMNLYLTVSPYASAFLGTSRLPGAVVIQDPTVELPIQ
jgi:pimeloyl-ACP methyl ester carboxylesterase